MEHVNVNGNCIFVKGEDVDELGDSLAKMMDQDYYSGIIQKSKLASQSFLYSQISKRSIGSL